MCGRYGFIHSPEDLEQAWGSLRIGGDFPPSYNRAPGQMHPVVRQAPDLSLELVPMRWGFVPHWGAQSKVLPINARAESITLLPLFREAFRSRRALIPADWFYEWAFDPDDPAVKQPMLLRARDHHILALAGIWDRHRRADGREEETFAILTVPALPAVAQIHGRMPLVLDPRHWPLWWHPHARRVQLEPCLQPADFPWETFPVSPRVNSTRYDAPEAALPWDGGMPD
ncbi:SOS response-associated peptidase [Acidithiobacillus sp.]|uniref:SOS response-associated peptidase n=1 Tax=Acidithiobacillus sp. TaxID=1872118 RepID=UPI003D050D34